METEVQKPNYGSEKKSRLSVSNAWLTNALQTLCLVAKEGLSLSNVRADYWHSQNNKTLIVVSFQDYGDHLLLSLQ